MTKSMTGFGRAEHSSETEKLTVEIKSVNHRYFDVSVKLPRKLNALDPIIRQKAKDFAKRGKIDIYITHEIADGDDTNVIFNQKIAEQYIRYGQQMGEAFGLLPFKSAAELSALPEVFTIEHAQEDDEELAKELFTVLAAAGEAFSRQRAEEGGRLEADILAKLEELDRDVAYIEMRAPQIIEEYKSRLLAKVKETLADAAADEARIMTEVVLYADRVCVDEETVRLKSHFQSMRSTFKEGDPDGIGRKLDFIAQEMNREANTILSKSNRTDITEAAIRLKTGIEKIREQVQNIE